MPRCGALRAFRASLTWARVLSGARVGTGPLAGCSVLRPEAGLALLSCQGASLLCVSAGGRDGDGGEDAGEVAAGDVLSFRAVYADDA